MPCQQEVVSLKKIIINADDSFEFEENKLTIHKMNTKYTTRQDRDKYDMANTNTHLPAHNGTYTSINWMVLNL